MTWPGSDLTTCWIASAPCPPGRVMLATPVCCPSAARESRAGGVEETGGLAKRHFDGNSGKDALVRAGDDDMPAGGDAPGGNKPGQLALQPLERRQPVLTDRSDAIEPFGEQIGDGGEVALDRHAVLTGLIEHLDERAEADGDQESDDQGRHGPAKRGLRYQ